MSSDLLDGGDADRDADRDVGAIASFIPGAENSLWCQARLHSSNRCEQG